MSNTKAIEQFLRTAYGDARLAALLCHAEDGRLSHLSCCCLAGFPDARHPYQSGSANSYTHGPMYWEIDVARSDVSSAFRELAASDAERRAKLIPLIKAEFQRREAMRNTNTNKLSCGIQNEESPSQAREKVLV